MKLILKTDNRTKAFDIYSPKGYEIMSELWNKISFHNRSMYESTWLGIPIIQYPNDMIMMQELIWKTKPDVIIEVGVAHGGSVIFYASILRLLGKGRVIGVDHEIRKHNKIKLNRHPLSKKITLIQGNSVELKTLHKVCALLRSKDKVMVVLDSDHSYTHVTKEMNLYSKIVTKGQYLVVMDGIQGLFHSVPSGKPSWKNDNPLRAIREFVSRNSNWKIDKYFTRLKVTCNPCGFLKKK